MEMGDEVERTDGEKARRRQLDELKEIGREGNRMLAEGNCTGAIDRYSQCIISIILARGQVYFDHNIAQDEDLNTVLALSYSNRAEVRLRLRDYKEAFDDAEQALRVDSYQKHVKSLVRKGRAAHGLELYQKACEAHKYALEEVVEESLDYRHIQKLLKESTIADEQSRTGNYDLANFLSRGGRNEVPSCADFLGPVEIRRASSGDGRRGLFARKSLEPGELLLVSNPLAATRQELATIHVPGQRFPEKLCVELADRIRRSKLQMARFRHLASDDIPSMELFRPASAWSSVWIPPGGGDSDLGWDFIRDFASKKMFRYVELNSPKADLTEVVGLWVLPAFANHSCAPNCQHSMVGVTIFFRASRHLMEGEELTISYFSDWFEFFEDRQESSQNLTYTCKCERCVFEEDVSTRLSKIYELVEVKRELQDRICGNAVNEVKAELVNATNEVEAVIRSLGTTVGQKQRGWIRACFISLYISRLMTRGEFSIPFLRFLVDSMTSVYVTPTALELAAWLLREIDRIYSRDSKTHRDTTDRVLSIYRVHFGKLPDGVLHNLIQENASYYLTGQR